MVSVSGTTTTPPSVRRAHECGIAQGASLPMLKRFLFLANFVLKIDWIHDFVKERVRLRHLRSMGGIRGMIRNRADSLKGWVLVLLTGMSCMSNMLKSGLSLSYEQAYRYACGGNGDA